MSAFLSLMHRAIARFYVSAHAVFEHGWYEALGHSRLPSATPECPVQQMRNALVQPLSGTPSND
ncbi:MAG TPA: hypothetical protein VFV57_08370 [Limnobacter sp.]|nr:hypothetical protein [Limnobacter sp.]